MACKVLVSRHLGVRRRFEALLECLDHVQRHGRDGDDDCDFADECGRQDKSQVCRRVSKVAEDD
jgi:hypothetical protein